MHLTVKVALVMISLIVLRHEATDAVALPLKSLTYYRRDAENGMILIFGPCAFQFTYDNQLPS